MAFSISFANVLKEDYASIKNQLIALVRSGKSAELHAFLRDRKSSRSLLTSIFTNASTKDYLSLLMMAVTTGNDVIVRQILLRSLNMAETVQLRGRIHSVDGTFVDNVTALWCALDRAHFTVARTLIEVGKANVNHGPIHPLLIDAVIRGRLDIVRFLVENEYADINEVKTKDQVECNSSILATMIGQSEMAKYSMKNNAQLEAKMSLGGNTALAVAAINGNLELVRWLCMAGASLTTYNDAKKTPIVLAAENEYFDIVGYFLEQDHREAVFDDLELAAALYILTDKETSKEKSEWSIELLKYSLVKRIQFEVLKVVAEPVDLYSNQRECQTVDEFNQIQADDNRLHVEALLIQERVLLSRDENLSLSWLFDRAMAFVNRNQFDQCLDLILHIFHLSQHGKSQPSPEQYFWLFYTMFKSGEPIPEQRFWEVCDLIFQSVAQDFDPSHKRDQLHLLGLATKIEHSEILSILREINLDYSDIANLYCHGSRTQGTCTSTSDRDLIIVAYSKQKPLTFWEDFDYFHEFQLHKLHNKYDVCVYSVENFEKLLEKNYLLCIQCLFLPKQFVVKEGIDFRSVYLDKYYDPKRIKLVALYEMYVSMGMMRQPKRSSDSEAVSITDDKSQARRDFIFKNLFHGIRFLDLAEQLIETRSIHDLTRVSHLLGTMKEIRGDPTDECALDRVLQFVRVKSTEMQSRLNALVPREPLVGLFKVHITFEYQSNFQEMRTKLKSKHNYSNYQFAILRILDKKDFPHLTATRFYHGEYPSMIPSLEKEIREELADFSIESITITSSISNDGVPNSNMEMKLLWDEQICCFQLCYKVFSCNQRVKNSIKSIISKRKSSQSLQSCLSSYKMTRVDEDKFEYILKVSLSDFDRKTVLEIHDEVMKSSKLGIVASSNIEPELVVYRTNEITQ
ncbi:unnamed protein product [Adineta ricciae]|uniref:ANK_REP_REGION domain-containing protein n=1 Tax=Adineta ricciae TaxID=249248 RepID=A0A815QP52_ADIRI|nr:unnamed protein product [Adineta ricciae]